MDGWMDVYCLLGISFVVLAVDKGLSVLFYLHLYPHPLDNL